MANNFEVPAVPRCSGVSSKDPIERQVLQRSVSGSVISSFALAAGVHVVFRGYIEGGPHLPSKSGQAQAHGHAALQCRVTPSQLQSRKSLARD